MGKERARQLHRVSTLCAGTRPRCANVPSGILSQSTVQKGDREPRAQIRLLSAGLQGWLDSRDPNEVPTLLELEVSWERQIACKHKKDR